MHRFWLHRLALAAALALPSVQAQDKLDGLEMDVMQPGQTPAQATSTIQLPQRANGQGNSRQSASDARDNAGGGGNGQDVAEQAREKHDSRKPDNPGNKDHGPTPSKPVKPPK